MQSIFEKLLRDEKFYLKKKKHLKEENPQEKSFYTYYKPQHKKKTRLRVRWWWRKKTLISDIELSLAVCSRVKAQIKKSFPNIFLSFFTFFQGDNQHINVCRFAEYKHLSERVIWMPNTWFKCREKKKILSVRWWNFFASSCALSWANSMHHIALSLLSHTSVVSCVELYCQMQLNWLWKFKK